MINFQVMRFIETSVFTRRVVTIADDEAHRRLQLELSVNPEKGRMIQGTGGLRKIRMAARGKGKSGGARVIYLHLEGPKVIYLVYVYDKGEADDLTGEQKKQLKAIAEAIKQEYRA
jgi:hypothetical protein